MWLLGLRLPAIFLVVGVVLASGATWSVQQWRWTAKHESELRKMLEAGAEATNRRQLAINSLREQSLEDADRIAALSRGVRVRCYTDAPGVPAPGPDANTPGDDRTAGVNATNVLRQCLRSFGEINRALRVTP